MLVGISGKKQSGKNTVALIWQYLYDKAQAGYKHPDSLDDFNSYIKNQHHLYSYYIQKSYAHKLKQIVCLLIGCTMEQLEDNIFKETPLGDEWNQMQYRVVLENQHLVLTDWTFCKEDAEIDIAYYSEYYPDDLEIVECEQILTPRLLLQLLGTQCGREIIHPELWVNALFADYKPMENKFISGNYMGTCKKCNKEFTGHKHEVWCEDCCKETPVSHPNWLITDCRFPNEVEAISKRDGITIRVNRGNLKTSAKWQEVFKDVIVLDPDGWDRKNYEYSWGEELISPEEYYNRVKQSTCKFLNEALSNLDDYFTLKKDTHASETALDDYDKFNYIINNPTGSIEYLIEEVKKIMIKEGVIKC